MGVILSVCGCGCYPSRCCASMRKRDLAAAILRLRDPFLSLSCLNVLANLLASTFLRGPSGKQILFIAFCKERLVQTEIATLLYAAQGIPGYLQVLLPISIIIDKGVYRDWKREGQCNLGALTI